MIHTLNLLHRSIQAAAVLAFAAVLVAGTLLATIGYETRQARKSAAALETAFHQADSSLVEYYAGLEEILATSADAHQWNTSTTEFFTRRGYPVQYVDSLTALYSSSHGLDEDASVKLHTRLTARMNSLHNDEYAPLIKKRWN